jgi:hypothetical protein
VNLHEKSVEAAEYSTVNVHGKRFVCERRTFWEAKLTRESETWARKDMESI